MMTLEQFKEALRRQEKLLANAAELVARSRGALHKARNIRNSIGLARQLAAFKRRMALK